MTATASDYVSILSALRTQQETHPLSILSLAEPILTSSSSSPADQHATSQSQSHSHTQSRQSDPSSLTSESSLTPSQLAADLAHYRDLFSKLRFSYLEQVTKEKYLRSIVGDPPILVSHAENADLEERLGGMKAVLKGRKEDVDAMVQGMEELARSIALRYESVQAGMATLERLPREVEGLEGKVEELRRKVAERRGSEEEGHGDERMKLGLEETEREVQVQRERNRELDREIEELTRALPGKMEECAKVERELEGLERKRNERTKEAREVRRLREEGGKDVLAEKARWYKAQEAVLSGLCGVDVEVEV